jgi:hypothetical protein
MAVSLLIFLASKCAASAGMPSTPRRRASSTTRSSATYTNPFGKLVWTSVKCHRLSGLVFVNRRRFPESGSTAFGPCFDHHAASASHSRRASSASEEPLAAPDAATDAADEPPTLGPEPPTAAARG